MNTPASTPELQRVRDLLPSYLNKTLARDGQVFMDTWMREQSSRHPELLDEMQWLVLTREQLRQSIPMADPEAGWHEVLARIDAAPRQALAGVGAGGDKPSLLARMLGWWAHPALATAAVLVMLAQSAGLWWMWPYSDGDVRPMSSNPAVDSASAVSPVVLPMLLQVVFKEQATAAQMREALAQVRGQVVGGPSALGVWRVTVPAPKASAALKTLQAHAAVAHVALPP